MWSQVSAMLNTKICLYIISINHILENNYSSLIALIVEENNLPYITDKRTRPSAPKNVGFNTITI